MKREHALVIGGGFAGLQAARVLANHFETVTILEKQTIQERQYPRLPFLTEDWRDAGATRILSMQNLPHVRIREGCTVTGLIPSIDNQSIQGVLSLSDKTDILKLRHADLVIDASGKTSRSSKWLQGLGYGTVEQLSAQTLNVRHLYEKLQRWPDRFLVIGDALCSFHPDNDEAQNICELQTQALDVALRSSPDLNGLSIQLQKNFAEVIHLTWRIESGDWRTSDALFRPRIWWSILKKATGLSGSVERNP